MSLSIRHAGPDDAPTLLRFIQGLADFEKEPGAVKVDADTLRQQLAASDPPFNALVAERAGQPLGFAVYFYNYSTWRGSRGLHLEDVFVPASSRGQGVGKALMAKLAAIARDQGCQRFEWNVLNWNTPAIEFYEHLGARPMEGWIGYRISDEALGHLADQDKS